ncbi:MAG: competence/damage-inducible protein A [Armatimonadota bacterium]
MQAEIISVGTELLLGQIIDTNAAYLSRLLPELGINLRYRATVGDNAERLKNVLKSSLERADIIFTIGGLGPTQDDLTRETVAEVSENELVLDESIAEQLKAFFSKRNIEMPSTNLKQAMVPSKGRVFENPNGTAPGAVFCTPDSKYIIILPGPPREFQPMVDNYVVPFIKEVTGEKKSIIKSRILRVAGLGESIVEDKIKHLLGSLNPTVAPLVAGNIEVHLRITAMAENEAEADRLIDKMDTKLVAELGSYVYGRDDQTLEQIVVSELKEKGLKLGLAESCTGGLIGDRITNVPGCSEVLLAGIVSYSNESKIRLLGVDKKTIEKYGAVSSETAEAMAIGIRKITGADVGVSVTGIAGPSGGSDEKPVGLVYMAVDMKGKVKVNKHVLYGKRVDIKARSAQNALLMLRDSILD